MNFRKMNTAQTTKNLAKVIAKQIAQEPLEILKKAPSQVLGTPEKSPPTENSSGPSDKTKIIERNQNELQDKAKGSRRIEALDRELKGIERDKLFKELQRKISEGQEVYLNEYPSLSMEQKQVLNAQIEAIKARNLQSENDNGLIEPTAKKGRRLFSFGQKQAAERQTTRVEKPVPPSG